ncbi:MAG: ABC transporter permease subunit [Actinomycetota bacterium]|nr:ABC transporter permease subunit [Actinomycetota bacterium]
MTVGEDTRRPPTDTAEVEAAHALHPVRVAASTRIPTWWGVVLLATVVASWWVVMSGGGPARVDLLGAAAGFVRDLLGVDGVDPPVWATSAAWRAAVGPAVDTVVMSLLGAATAGVVALATVIFASRPLRDAPHRQVGTAGRLGLVATRGMHVLTRAVPDYIWALLLVFVVRPGVIAAALALALHNIGVMGRLGSDVVEDLHPGPLEALRSAGAGRLQVLAYGVLPQVLPQFLTFLLYRWEVMMRAAAVVGFVALAGVGYQLRLALSLLRWSEVGLWLAVYVALVLLADLTSSALRRLAR